MRISLRRGERIYINGAVIRMDRKVCVELLNDVTFLLENHVMQAADATTPIKQLYFAIQLMLISPSDATSAMRLSREFLVNCLKSYRDRRIADVLDSVPGLIDDARYFDALKAVRSLFSVEAEMLDLSNSADQLVA